jgi:hypothetical protein
LAYLNLSGRSLRSKMQEAPDVEPDNVMGNRFEIRPDIMRVLTKDALCPVQDIDEQTETTTLIQVPRDKWNNAGFDSPGSGEASIDINLTQVCYGAPVPLEYNTMAVYLLTALLEQVTNGILCDCPGNLRFDKLINDWDVLLSGPVVLSTWCDDGDILLCNHDWLKLFAIV